MRYAVDFSPLFQNKVEVEEYGIPYVSSIIEEDLDDMEIERWNLFWEYFDRQWVPILDSWNICDEDGKHKEILNRTKNGLERYNKRFNRFFEKKPSLIEFCEVVEAESRYQDQVLEDVQMGRIDRPNYQGVFIPAVSKVYRMYVANMLFVCLPRSEDRQIANLSVFRDRKTDK